MEHPVVPVEGARNGRSTAVWLQRLVHEIARPEPSAGIDAMLGVVVRASRSAGAILWEAPEVESATVPSLVGRWFPDGMTAPDSARPDPVTVEAFHSRTLAMATGAGGPRGRGPAVTAALPVDHLDGGAGALTLYGDGELTGDSFDIVVDLLAVLPVLCAVLRERRCLALVRRCNDIIQEAEVESAWRLLDSGNLRHHLGRLCTVVADALSCREVTVFLRVPGSPDGTFPLVASSVSGNLPGSPARSGVGLVGRTIEDRRPLLATHDEAPSDGTVMAAPLMDGNQVTGAIACAGTGGPPFHFTQSDLSALRLIAPHVAQYWRNWLHRRTISMENQSWLLLAAGITAFNRLASEQLAHPDPDDQRVYGSARQIIQDVIPDCLGCEVHRTGGGQSGATRLHLAQSSGAGGDGPRPFTLSVLQSGRQRATTEPDDLAREGVDPGAGWLTGTPIHISGQPYGVLGVFGRGATVPANALQVCEIIGDQLGLYLHLRQALQGLQETRGKLQDTLRSQAEALEDLEHQLGGPLLVATERADFVINHGRVEGRTESQLRAVRGLCRKAMRVAMSAGVFAALSRGTPPTPKLELLSVDDLLRLLIAAADDAQLLSNPRRRIRFEVERDGIRALGRRLIKADRSFVEQCVGNLLDNAAKYSYEDTVVNVSGDLDDHTFAVTVVSIGLPVTTSDAGLCLRRNWRGPAARVTTGEGSGLGLWIADHLMRSMKGTVRVRPAQDMTTVILTFPLA